MAARKSSVMIAPVRDRKGCRTTRISDDRTSMESPLRRPGAVTIADRLARFRSPQQRLHSFAFFVQLAWCLHALARGIDREPGTIW